MKREKRERAISDELIDALLKQAGTPEDVNALLKQLTKAVLERALQGEMTEHLGYAKHDPAGDNSGNSRNGVTRKTLKGDFGEIELETPRDRNGEFEPQIRGGVEFLNAHRSGYGAYWKSGYDGTVTSW